MYRDLGLLKRDKKLQKRYDEWAVGIVAKYGSIGKFFYHHDHTNFFPSRLNFFFNFSHLFVELPFAMGESGYPFVVDISFGG